MKLDSCWPFFLILCKPTWKFLVELQFIIKPCTPNLAVFFEQKGLFQKVGCLHSQYFPVSINTVFVWDCLGVTHVTNHHRFQRQICHDQSSDRIEVIKDFEPKLVPKTVGSVDPAVLGSSKNTDSYCLKFHPYSSVVPKLASPLPLGCKSWRHTAIRPYEMPVVDTSYVKASNPTFLGAGFFILFSRSRKKGWDTFISSIHKGFSSPKRWHLRKPCAA